ncbi:twin-arginine translocase subunit TatC [Limnoglobus roseus]|uniref:Sec-independent protein translocase protein TatC n=1 Tax=Limnoglobus roseus TaxID=2598579 RepID=A0A5C1AB51_9BACT|nr:twin-arginine translocase subunit TatC [Limnoglobus roseus]QEL15950.1 preprotein translocase subunit TatC [Limnoglobus roseus]
MPRPSHDDDDIFKDSRMSFGDHIEELRTRLLAAVKGLVFVLMIGLVLDYIGVQAGIPQLGIGRPVMKMIVDPVESQTRDFYAMKVLDDRAKLPTEPTPPEEVERIRKKLADYDGALTALTEGEQLKLRAAPRELPILIPVEPFKSVFGAEPKDKTLTQIPVTIQVYPAHITALTTEGEGLLASKRYLKTLSAQESLIVYFKVSLLSSFVVASPWIFFQIWAFVAAGMYPNERAYVYRYLPFSIGLFLTGILLCQFIVLPGAVKALLAFNNWIDTDPDLRLNEWLSFAIILPLVFGASFQTPLVMFFFNRLGMFSWEDYWAKWRYAVLVLAIFAAVITPTPDAVTMLYLFVPMFGLYMLGVAICRIFPPAEAEYEPEEAEIAV